MFQSEYDKLIKEVNNKIQSKIDALIEQEKYWSKEQKIKAKEIRQLIEWQNCRNSWGICEQYNEPLTQYFSQNYEEEILHCNYNICNEHYIARTLV